jgi:3-oxoacyl-[acyl-carrier protein] reductase
MRIQKRKYHPNTHQELGEQPKNMDLKLTNKIALVTGASSGIGSATAKILAEEGADVMLGYHQNHQGALQTAETIQSLGRQAWTFQMDIAKPKSIKSTVQKIKVFTDKLDILILCAGLNIITPLQEITPDEWEKVLSINLGGPFYMVQALLPLLHPGASIVTVSSVAAHTGAPHHIHYAAAKSGLINLTKSLARRLTPHIRVNCVAPGLTATDMGKDTIASLPANYVENKLLVRDFASPREIASAIVFVASPAVPFMTGATIDINGGRDLR